MVPNSNSANSDNIQQGGRSVNFISLGRDRHHHPETNIHRYQHLIVIKTENFFQAVHGEIMIQWTAKPTTFRDANLNEPVRTALKAH